MMMPRAANSTCIRVPVPPAAPKGRHACVRCGNLKTCIRVGIFLIQLEVVIHCHCQWQWGRPSHPDLIQVVINHCHWQWVGAQAVVVTQTIIIMTVTVTVSMGQQREQCIPTTGITIIRVRRVVRSASRTPVAQITALFAWDSTCLVQLRDLRLHCNADIIETFELVELFGVTRRRRERVFIVRKAHTHACTFLQRRLKLGAECLRQFMDLDWVVTFDNHKLCEVTLNLNEASWGTLKFASSCPRKSSQSADPDEANGEHANARKREEDAL